jgi:hypothetical protein
VTGEERQDDRMPPQRGVLAVLGKQVEKPGNFPDD